MKRGTVGKTEQMDQEGDQHPNNPADRPLVTLDTNIVIALRNNEDKPGFMCRAICNANFKEESRLVSKQSRYDMHIEVIEMASNEP